MVQNIFPQVLLFIRLRKNVRHSTHTNNWTVFHKYKAKSHVWLSRLEACFWGQQTLRLVLGTVHWVLQEVSEIPQKCWKVWVDTWDSVQISSRRVGNMPMPGCQDELALGFPQDDAHRIQLMATIDPHAMHSQVLMHSVICCSLYDKQNIMIKTDCCWDQHIYCIYLKNKSFSQNVKLLSKKKYIVAWDELLPNLSHVLSKASQGHLPFLHHRSALVIQSYNEKKCLSVSITPTKTTVGLTYTIGRIFSTKPTIINHSKEPLATIH